MEHWQRIALALLFLVAARVANVTVPLVLKRIVDTLGSDVDVIIIVPLGLLVAYGLLRFGAILFNELRNMVFSRAGIDIIRSISQVVFAHLHNLSLSFHLDRKTGGLSRDIDRGNIAITNFLRIIVFNILPVIIEITLVLIILWKQLDIGYVIVTVVMIIIYAIFTFLMTRWRTKFRVQMNESDSSANTRILDSLLNYETVKVFGNEEQEKERYDQSLKTWAGASLKNSFSLSYLNAGQGLIIAIGLTIMMVMAADGVASGALTIGDFVMVNAFLIQIYIPLNFLGSVYRDLNHSLVDMERMFDLLEIEPDVVEKPDAGKLDLSAGKIRFENVSFSFNPEKPTLSDINFEVPGGGMLAVVGPSGAGKSTLARLLLRFYDPDSGSISIDDQNIRDLSLQSLRAVMGVVPQDTVLFNETIGYNIGYGRLGSSKKEIEQAARIAQIHDFISRHPRGYDILVGERGLKLSGGEKQRVAIARVALKGARILIFDEATSSLDSRSEKAIQRALENVSANNTTLVIAHRLSTVVNADEIIVLDQGKIAERGTHTSLISQSGLYAQMWDLQQQHN
jgi:ATP-binding cassette subfamily B protein